MASVQRPSSASPSNDPAALPLALLAVLKAGGAYLPLDPLHPSDRLAKLVADAAPAAIIASRTAAALLPSGASIIIIDDAGLADEEERAGAIDDDDPVAVGLRPDHPAYVIYTSGSTGTPKGVVVTHRNVARLFAAADQDYRFTPADTWTLFHSASFDFSVWEMYGALLYGGRLVVVPVRDEPRAAGLPEADRS